MSYLYSNGGHKQLFKRVSQECLLEDMKAIFEHIEGVPTAILFDNMSFEIFIHEFVKAYKYGKVKFDGKIYSTFPNIAGQ